MRWHNSMISLTRDAWLAFEKTEEILSAQHEQFGLLTGRRVRGAALAVKHGDLAEEITGPKEIQGQPAAVGGPGLDPDLAAADPKQSVAGVALLKQHLADTEVLGVASAEIRCNSSGPRSANIGFIFRITANSACLLIAIPSPTPALESPAARPAQSVS